MLLQILPNLLINAVLPLAINMLAQLHMSTINALLLASLVLAMLVLNPFLNFGVIMPATYWIGFSTIAFSLFPFLASTQRMEWKRYN